MIPMGGYREGDVIAAEATPRGRGGISVVRVSGRGAYEVVQKIFDAPLPEGGRHRFGRLIGATGEAIDEVVVAAYAAPNSYTCEDVLEISMHGNPLIVAETLGLLYNLGVRTAEPGEFTYRAFINGRLDLTQAEAVCDLIAASTRDASRQALRQLDGGIGVAAEKVAVLIERLLVGAELELDFVEEDVELMPASQKITIVDEAIKIAEGMLDGYAKSRRLREGVKVAITGAPNVGKSSLFNALVGEARAIVHPKPGTTRDVVEARRDIGGIEFKFFDTAGIRQGAGEVEDEGIRRALETAKNADLILDVDSVDFPSEEQAFDERILQVRNKCDLEDKSADGRIRVSAITGEGMESLAEGLLHATQGDTAISEASISRERHFVLVRRALEAMVRGREALVSGLTGEMIAEEWRDALSALDELTGRRRLAGLLETIFGEFCIGK